MGYDVTNNSSTIELVSGKQIPASSDLIPIVLPEQTPSPELIGVDAITPKGDIVQLPDIVPTPELIGVDTITPVGDVVVLPEVVPPDGIVLLETIPIPDSGQFIGIKKLINLEDVEKVRVGGDVLVYNDSTGTYQHINVDADFPLFTSDISVILNSGKSLGKYLNGDTIPAIGKTASEVLIDIATEYINSAFTSFSISGQATTVEVGTTLSGSKTFIWNISENAGEVNVIDIYDITDVSYISIDTPNDGSEPVTIISNQLNIEGEVQQWRGRGTDITPDPDINFNSSTFTVIGRYYRFFGPASASVTDSVSVRALPSSAFQTSNVSVFSLETGNTLIKFIVCLPPGITITKVVDLTALGLDITSNYVAQSSIDVNDDGGSGTARTYNIYEMNIAIPYLIPHDHQITTG